MAANLLPPLSLFVVQIEAFGKLQWFLSPLAGGKLELMRGDVVYFIRVPPAFGLV